MPLDPHQPVAFISVYDKTGLEPLAKALTESYGYQLLSTGGTCKFLQEKGIAVTESTEVTGFGELLDGRVKSLQPDIFAGILAKRADAKHMGQIRFAVDTVVVNLYPFEEGLKTSASDEAAMIELIDVGGVALIRAAAKNFEGVNVLCDAGQYDAFLQEMKLGDGKTSKTFRKNLALAAFKRSSSYDTAIAAYFEKKVGAGAQPNVTAHRVELADTLDLGLTKITDLRYGENPHQKAALYGYGTRSVDFEQLNGKELSFNNLVDMEAGWAIATEFVGTPACVIIKHNNPCGAAIGHSPADAYQRAFGCDPLSAFGGIVALNCPVTKAAAEQMKEVFLELVIAPAFEPDALALLTAKKNLRLIQRPLPPTEPQPKLDVKQISASHFLVQTDETPSERTVEHLLESGALSIVTEDKPTDAQMADLVFAWKIAKHAKSNAIILAKEGRTVGLGTGQTSRIGALEIALRQACDEAKDAVMASDGFFPATDNIHAAVQARVAAVIQPGGSIKDPDVISLANLHHLPMVTTGIREFKH